MMKMIPMKQKLLKVGKCFASLPAHMYIQAKQWTRCSPCTTHPHTDIYNNTLDNIVPQRVLTGCYLRFEWGGGGSKEGKPSFHFRLKKRLILQFVLSFDFRQALRIELQHFHGSYSYFLCCLEFLCWTMK